ncbi:MAG: hypothetical protein RIT03_1113, partial [Bacteroidota bacterium]
MITNLPTPAGTKKSTQFTLSRTPKFLQTALLSALFFLLLGVGESWGQVSNYTFSQSTGTYTAITGTGVFTSTTWDDNTAALSLPFTFTFNGIGYSTVNVNSNGYVTFGSTTSSTTNFTPVSSSETYASCISAFGRDLVNNGLDVTYITSGSSPNRVFVVQWNNARRFATSARNGNYNFQIRLNETTNVIQVVYNVATSSYATSLTHQIGLRGNSNSDYMNRTSSTNFSSTTAGTANTATVSTGNTVALNPVAGQTYTWTPPAPCTAPTSLSASVTSSAQTNTTISGAFTAATTAPSGYVVVRTTANTQPTLTNGTTYTVGTSGSNYIEYVGSPAGSWSSTGLTAGTTYYYWVFSYKNTACSGGPAYSTTASTLTQATSSCTGASLASLSYTLTSPTYCSGVAITTNSATLGTTNGIIAYSVSPALPTGLSLNTSTGAITGTPSATSVATAYTVTANNGCTTTTATVTIAVVTPLSALTYTTTPATYCVGTAITTNSATITGGGTITYSVSPALPAGLSLNTATGAITGTPTASAASATYTVTATNGSCSTTKALTIVVNNNLGSSTLTYGAQSVNYCQNTAISNNNATLNPATNNGTVTYSISPALSAGLTLNTSTGRISGTPTAAQSTTSYTVTATSACGGSTTSVVSITVNTPGSVTAPAAASICSGGTGVSLTASGISSYTWSPTTGLTGTGATVTANPITTTTYTISGTDANGCTASSGTVTVTVNQTPSAITIAQTPASICSGGVATLTAIGGSLPSGISNYTFGASSGSFVPLSSGNPVSALQVDDIVTSAVPIGFTFNYLGTNYSNVYPSSNGFLSLNGSATGSSSAANNLTSPSTTATNIAPLIAPLWDDLSGSTGTASYLTTGSVGSRVFTFEWLNWLWSYSASSSVISFQVKLYEATGKIEFIYRQEATPINLGSASIGLTGASGVFASLNNTGTSPTVSNSIETSSINAKPATGQIYSFTPPTAAFSWSPTTNLFTDAAATTAYTGGNATTVYALNTSTTAYTATATSGTCSTSKLINTTVNLLPTITLGSTSAVCAGGIASSLSFSAPTGSPDQYIIDYDATANSVGFADVASYTAFSSSPISLVIPAGAAAGTYNGTITVKNSTTGCISSATSFTVTVNAPVSISAQPNNSVSLEGSDATFSVNATGTGLTYQWQVSTDSGSSWNNASGTSTNSSFTESSITASMAGYQYRCIVSGTSPCGSVTSSVATLSISSTAITSQPASATICSTASNTFTIATSGTTPTYQWQVSTNAGSSFTDISGETAASLTVSGLTASNSGNQYRCVLSGTINSDPATLTVYNVVAISTQPVSQTVCSNATSGGFSVSATGSNLTYQWQVSANAGSTWTNVSGATSDSLSFTSFTNVMNGYQYRVTVSGSSPCAAVTSDAVTLNVTGVAVSTTSSSICLNNPVTLTATPTSGAPAFTYSWICATTGSGATSAQTSNPATITPTAAGSYTYTLTVTGGGCTFTSTTAVTVNDLPTITSATASPSSLCSGSSVSLNAASIPSSSGVSGASGAGASTSSSYPSPFGNSWWGAKQQFILTAADLSAMGLVAGNITAVSFDITSPVTTALTNYTISAKSTATAAFPTTALFETGLTTLFTSPSYIPSSGTGYANNKITFTTPFNWNGTSNIVFEICFNNTAYNANATCSYTTKSYNASSYYYADAAGVCSQTNGSYYSSVVPNMKFEGQLGTNQTANYSWSWNTFPAISTAAGSTTAVNSTNSPISQTYTVTATSPITGCASTSTTAAITINPTPATPTANSTTICGAQNATCSVTGSGVVGNTFKWYTASTGGTALAGQTGSSLNAYPVSTNTTFYVSEANSTCESARVAVMQTVTTPPTLTASASSATICAGQPTTLSVSSANSGYSYSWNNSAGTGTSVSVSPTTTTTYTITATDTSGGASNGCSTSGTVTVTVNPVPTSVTATASSGTICNGSSINLTSTSNLSNITFADEGFESGLPSGWTILQNGSGNLWATTTGTTYGTAYQGSGMLQYLWNSSNAANTYTITSGYNLVAGKTYTINFYELTGTYNERLKLTVGTAQTVAAQSTVIADYPVHQVTTWTLRTNTFTPTVSGTYYFGLNAYSASNRYYLNVDNFSITTPITTTYSWASSPAGFTSSTQNPTGVTPTETTIYTVTSTNSYGCSATASTTVTVNPLPTATITAGSATTFCSGGSVVLTANAGSSYVWKKDGNTIPGAAAQTYTATTAGAYTVTVTNAYVCSATSAATTVTVNTSPNMPTASNVTLCGTGSVTLTATDPGVGYSINWYNTAQDTQLAAASLTFTTPSLSTTTTYYAEVENTTTGCKSQNRTAVQAIVNVTNTFTDTTNDHSWFTAGNWSCGTIPTATTNVVIPTAKTVSVYYDINGAPAYANTIVLEGTAAVTVTTDHSMNVTNKVTVASGANFTVQNNASLLQTDNVANEGNITVVKTTPSARLLKRYDAVLWSSPVVQNLRAISTGTPDAYFMQHNPQANSWSAVSSPATADFTKGKGFLVRTPSTFPTTATQQWNVTFTGVPNNGDVTLSAGDTGNTEKYLLVGNPYPSAISIASFKAGNPNITGVFYFYRKPNGITSISAYGTLAANGQFSTNDADNLVGALTPGDVIPSGQGFFVAMKSDNNNGNVYFTNAMRVANDHGHFNRVNTNLDSYKLIVKTPVGGNSQLIMNYDSETTNGYDVGYDAVAFTDGTTDLSSIMNNEKYRIQSKGDYNIADVIPVQFKTGVAGEHRIKLQDAQGVFAANQMVIIKDNLTGVQHNLTANGDYVFTSATGTFTNRFEVIYQQAYYTALQANSCGATIANMSSLVYADIVNGATGYRFKVVNNTTSAVQT